MLRIKGQLNGSKLLRINLILRLARRTRGSKISCSLNRIRALSNKPIDLVARITA